MSSSAFTLRVVPELRTLPAEAWDALLGPNDSPFVRHAWLVALEDAGCVTPAFGWAPHHLTLWEGETLVAAAPAYLKGNSEGEFVFDHAWEHAAQRAGIPYYPKLLVAVPFTPATGTRLLAAAGPDRDLRRRALAQGIRAVTEGLELTGAHVLFPTREDLEVLTEAGFFSRYGAQFHWSNHDYGTYDDFLASFNAKRRHQLKRERKEVLASGLTVRTLRGPDLNEAARDAMYGFYENTTAQYFPYTRRYLNRTFFDLACATMPDAIEFVFAYDGDRPIAGAFNVAGSGRLYGRYWGAVETRPFLHFHVCYYHSIEQCIARGARVFEPGAGGEHKLPRGFEPTLTFSAHFLTEPRLDQAVRRHVEYERGVVEEAVRSKTER